MCRYVALQTSNMDSYNEATSHFRYIFHMQLSSFMPCCTKRILALLSWRSTERGTNIHVVVPRLRNHRVITLQTAHLMDEVYTYLSYNEYPVNATASQKKASGDEPKTSKGDSFLCAWRSTESGTNIVVRRLRNLIYIETAFNHGQSIYILRKKRIPSKCDCVAKIYYSASSQRFSDLLLLFSNDDFQIGEGELSSTHVEEH